MCTTLRPLDSRDLPFAHSLSRLAGWNQTLRDWERFLTLGEGGCFLAEYDGCPAGTATTTCYGSDLAWIGMVLVHPDFRRRGIGGKLLHRAINHLRNDRGIACVRLDATPEGRPLYESLGFQAEWGLRRWRREGGGNVTDEALRTPEVSDASCELDEGVFGADRSALLRSLAEGSLAGVSLPDGSFGLMRDGERAVYLGPVTAGSSASGIAMIENLVRQCPGDRVIFWDLPDQNTIATDLALSLGFRPVRELTRMWLGDAPAPFDPSRNFGLAEPGLG